MKTISDGHKRPKRRKVSAAPGEAYATDAGNPGYKGWDYQKWVSAWLLIDILVGERWASSIVLEPDTQEDAEVTEDPEHAGAWLEGKGTRKLTLDIQVKLRSNMIWSSADLRNVMMSGAGKVKTPAVDRLRADASRRWLLITSAAVNHDLKRHEVRTWAPTDPTKVKFADEKLAAYNDVAGRVGILGPIDARIRALAALRTACKMPEDRREDCLVALCALVERAWLGQRDKRVTRDEIIDVVQTYGGCPPERVRADYIEPAQYQRALELLRTQGLVVLIGPPGVGKTTTALELRNTLLRENPSMKINVKDDPFEWSVPLGEVERNAIALDRKEKDEALIVTTRPEWLQRAFPGQPRASIRRACLKLSSASYSVDARWTLLEAALPVGGWHHEWARGHRPRIAKALHEPQSFAYFGRDLALCTIPEEVDLAEMISDAQVRNVHAHVARLAESVGPGSGSALVLLLALRLPAPILAAKDDEHPFAARLERLTDRIRSRGARVEPRALTDLLLRAGRLDGTLDSPTAHAEVIRGLGTAIVNRLEDAREVVKALVQATDPRTEVAWLAWVRALIEPISRDLFPAVLGHALDKVLRQDLTAATKRGDFSLSLYRLGRFGGADDELTLLARALYDPDFQPDQWHRRFRFATWAPPKWTDAQWQRVAASSRARAVAERFVRDELVSNDRFGSGALARFFRDLGWAKALAPAFREALKSAPFATATRDMMIGALAGKERFDAILRHLDAQLCRLEEEQSAACQDEHDASAQQRDLSDEAAHIEGQILAVVEERRRLQGWRWIPGHALLRRLVDPWAFLIREAWGAHGNAAERPGPDVVDGEELAALWKVSEWSRKRVTTAMVAADQDLAKRLLVTELLSVPDQAYPARAAAAVAGLMAMGEDNEPGAAVLAEVAQRLDLHARAVLTQVLADPPADGAMGTKHRAHAYLAVFRLVREAEWCRELARAVQYEDPTAMEVEELVEVLRAAGCDAIEVLTQLGMSTAPVLASSALLALALGGREVPVERVKDVWTSASTSDGVSRALLAWTADALGTIEALELLSVIGCVDPDFRARARAVDALGRRGLHLDSLLALASDRSGRVRLAVAKALKRHQVAGDRTVLLRLALDDWNSDPYALEGGERCLEVARAAVDALKQRLPLTVEERTPLEQRLREGNERRNSDRQWAPDDWTLLQAIADVVDDARLSRSPATV